jgi:type IV pilus biogenesis protein CpaD/CtpE
LSFPSVTRSSVLRLRALPRARLAAVLALSTLLAAACDSSSPATPAVLDVAGIQSAIEHSIAQERGIATIVICPDVPRKSGFRFTCTARLDVGSYPINVVEDANGGVTYSGDAPLRVLDSRTVELAIQHAILKQRHLAAVVSCPQEILQQKGLRFTCTARTGKGVAVFTVTELDGDGHLRSVGD